MGTVVTKIELLKLSIDYQGGIIINFATVKHKTKKVCLVEVDMESKYAELWGDGEDNLIPNIMIIATGRTLNIKPDCLKEPTTISFPTLKGWSVFCSETSKCTIRIVFIKK